jgi:hypothetical protein
MPLHVCVETVGTVKWLAQAHPASRTPAWQWQSAPQHCFKCELGENHLDHLGCGDKSLFVAARSRPLCGNHRDASLQDLLVAGPGPLAE